MASHGKPSGMLMVCLERVARSRTGDNPMKGADIIAHALVAEGVGYLTCYPHSEIIDAAASVGIRPIATRTLRGAVHIADGFARMTGGRRMIATTMQYGPGIENAYGAIAQAFSDNVPILCLPTGQSRTRRGVAPNFRAAAALAAVTKASYAIDLIERLPQTLQHAFARLRNGKPGPVAIETPYDILDEEAAIPAYRPAPRSVSAAAPDEARRLLDAVLAARSPVILAGQGVLYAGAAAELLEFAELLAIPVMTTPNGKSAFPETHALALGAAASARPWTVDHFYAKADLILGLGTSFTRSDYIAPIPDGKTLLQVVVDDSDIAKDYPVAQAVIADVKCLLQQIISLAYVGGLRRCEDATDIARDIAGVRAKFLAAWDPLLKSDALPINPYRVVWELNRAFDKTRTVLTHDAGSPRDQLLPFYEAVVPHGYMGWGKSTQMGLSLPLMIGAKLAEPDWLCVNLMGDAAFGMIATEIETAVRCNLPILTILLNNGMMGGYAGYLPVAAAAHNVHRLGGDYTSVARAFGAYAETVTEPKELSAAIQRGVEQTRQGRPALLEVITGEENRFSKGSIGRSPIADGG